MPRKSRIDAADALHHIIVRGIERGGIFLDNIDRDRFIDRLSRILSETATQCYAWTFIPNHAHFLLKTGLVPIKQVVQRLLTGYAISYNRRHKRCGHLFQNRYKSILCQEAPYFLELVRYIHLNPIRADIVAGIAELDNFPYCGHGALAGTMKYEWQNTDAVLRLFSDNLTNARQQYRQFVEKGLAMGQRNDLTGGGLIRSSGGWTQVVAMRHQHVLHKSDERILGDGEFVAQVLANVQEQMERKYKGIHTDTVIERVCEVLNVEKQDVFAPGKERNRVKARSLFCYWTVRELGISQAALSLHLKLSPAAVTQSVKRGEAMVKEKGYSLL